MDIAYVCDAVRHRWRHYLPEIRKLQLVGDPALTAPQDDQVVTGPDSLISEVRRGRNLSPKPINCFAAEYSTAGPQWAVRQKAVLAGPVSGSPGGPACLPSQTVIRREP